MEHSFNIAVAKEVGIASAVILNNIFWWTEKNRANETHFHDGYYWTYNSRKAYCDLFPYLTERQIEYALKKLIEVGYVVTGNYNKSAYDRTLWYRLTETGYEALNTKIHLTNLLNGETENVEPIPDIKTNSKPTKKSLSKDKEGQAPKSYKDVYSSLEYINVRDALVKFVNSCKGKGYNPKVDTVEKFAKDLKEYSSNDSGIAMRIVDYCISQSWKAIYPPKDKALLQAVSVNKKQEYAKDKNGNVIVF